MIVLNGNVSQDLVVNINRRCVLVFDADANGSLDIVLNGNRSLDIVAKS